MIKMREACSWLNYGQSSQLTMGSEELMNNINRSTANDTTFMNLVEKAYETSQHSPFPLEGPEILAKLGCVFFYRDEAIQSANYLQQAIDRLRSHNYQRGVVSWMLGIACSAYSDFVRANLAWEESCSLLSGLASAAKQPFLRQRLDEMQRDMAETPGQAYTWLYLFEPWTLSASIHHLVGQLADRVNKQDRTRSCDLIGELEQQAKQAKNPVERAEIFVECGKAAFYLGNPVDASKYLSQALHGFLPRTHQSLVTRWMLGAVLWYSRNSYMKAQEEWQACLSEIDYLIETSDYKNHKSRTNWYVERREIMDAALRDRLEDKYYRREPVD